MMRASFFHRFALLLALAVPTAFPNPADAQQKA